MAKKPKIVDIRHNLQPDVQMTRRKRYHIVTDEMVQTLFAANTVSAAIDWLYENEVETFRLHTGRNVFRVTMSLETEEKAD